MIERSVLGSMKKIIIFAQIPYHIAAAFLMKSAKLQKSFKRPSKAMAARGMPQRSERSHFFFLPSGDTGQNIERNPSQTSVTSCAKIIFDEQR